MPGSERAYRLAKPFVVLRMVQNRPEGPLCNSHDRKVVVTSVSNYLGGPKDRHEPPFMSALRASIVLLALLPRPDGRGYCRTALRACEPGLILFSMSLRDRGQQASNLMTPAPRICLSLSRELSFGQSPLGDWSPLSKALTS